MTLSITRFDIAGPLLVQPRRFSDSRGFFEESYNQAGYAVAGIHCRFVQDNHSLSAEPGTIRGLHFQTAPHAQHKLIRVFRGRVLDIALDIRKGSPTFGQHLAVELTADNGRQLYIPDGFAHGFCTLEPNTEIFYKVSDFYAPAHEFGLLWNDPALGISWPSFAGAQMSAKDQKLPTLREFTASLPE